MSRIPLPSTVTPYELSVYTSLFPMTILLLRSVMFFRADRVRNPKPAIAKAGQPDVVAGSVPL